MYKLFGILSTFLVVLSSAAFAQTSEPADVDGAPAPEDALLTQAELENSGCAGGTLSRHATHSNSCGIDQPDGSDQERPASCCKRGRRS